MSTDNKTSTANLLFQRAEKMGLRPEWLTPSGVFSIQTVRGEKYVNLAVSSLNPHIGTSLALNKYLARVILQRKGLPSIPFTLAKTQAEAAAFLSQNGKIIAKPIRGAGSFDIHIITKNSELAELLIHKYILEKYVAGKEMRYLVLQGKVIAVHESRYGTSVAYDRHLERISFPPEAWSTELIDLSLEITRVFGLQFATIDYLIDEHGIARVLEVNTTPGLKWFHAPSSGPVVDVAKMFLEAMVDDFDRPAFTTNKEIPAIILQSVIV